jgi:hypothetical protein
MNPFVIIIAAAFCTAIISGVFGMAGGLVFMGIIAVFLGVAEAMVVHGAVQSVSNSYRAFLLRENVRWDILGWTAAGALPAALLMVSVSFLPSKAQLYLALGLLPLLLWLPKRWLSGDAQKTSACGSLRRDGYGIKSVRWCGGSGTGFLLRQNHTHAAADRGDQGRDHVCVASGQNRLFRLSACARRRPCGTSAVVGFRTGCTGRYGRNIHWNTPAAALL